MPYEIRLHYYDERGRETWMGCYLPDMILRQSLEMDYDEAGRVKERR